jgi:hypothetical protein
MEQVEIILDDINWTVWGYYEKEERDVNYGSQFDIQEVYNGCDNIIDFITDSKIEQMKDLAIEKLTEY